MLKLFLSMSTLKRLERIKEIDWWLFIKRIIFVLIILFFIAFGVFIDILVCISLDVAAKNENIESSYSKIEEVVLLHEKEIINVASLYDSNYDILSKDTKISMEFDYDDVKVSFDKNSEEGTIISAQSSSYNIDFILKGNKLEKSKDNKLKEQADEESQYLIIKIFICVFCDLIIALLGYGASYSFYDNFLW